LGHLKYSIRSEWAEGQIFSKILETYEDVTVPRLDHLSNDDKKDELLVEIWKESVKQHVVEVRALTRAKVKLYSTVRNLLLKVLQNKVTSQPSYEGKSKTCDVVWLLNTVRALVTDFDSAIPEILSIGEALEKILTYRQTETMENADYVKNLAVLIRVNEQYCGAYSVHMGELKRIDTQIQDAVNEAGNPFSANVQAMARSSLI
jgi:hypothetical protein